MKLLFAALPADGHFNPLTGLATQLALRGHDVRWYAGPEYARRVERLGMPCFPYRAATEVTAENLGTLYPDRAKLKGPKLISFDIDHLFVANVAHHFRDVTDIRSTFAYDALVCDGAVYAAQLVAEKLRVPVFAIALSSVLPNGSAPPPFFGLKPARTIVDRAVHRVVQHMLNSTSKAGIRRYNAILAAEGIAPIPPNGFPAVPMLSATRVFLNGSPGLEFPGYVPPANAEFVGPLAPATAPTTQALPAAVTDSGRTVVVVSQGTVDNDDPEKLIAPTLDALANSSHVVVATTGGKNTAELRARYTSPNVVIEDFLPFDTLFAQADVFVTNGGFGSTLAAFRHGVPVVTAGTREGKNDLNARTSYNRLGVDLRTERPKPAAIARAVHDVLAAADIAANVERLRAELDSYRPIDTIERAITATSTAGSG